MISNSTYSLHNGGVQVWIVATESGGVTEGQFQGYVIISMLQLVRLVPADI